MTDKKKPTPKPFLKEIKKPDGLHRVCSVCRKDMAYGQPKLLARFKEHVAEKHSSKKPPSEDVNQAAFRIVREATKD